MKSLCIIFVFFATTSAITFNCDYQEVSWLALGVNYQCQTAAFDVGVTPYVTSISGNHLPNKNTNDVIAIHIGNCSNLSYIPKGLLTVFPNLIGIYLEACGVSTLIGTELNEYPKLTLFALENSTLEFVPGNLFANTPDMILISLAFNQIRRTGSDLLTNMNNLSEVYFEGNKCIDRNANVTELIPPLIEALDRDCSIASEMFKSVSVTFLLTGVAYFLKYNWIS